MSTNDRTDAFLDQHSQLQPLDPFTFSCHPGVCCFNACCSRLRLILTPYDVYRLHCSLHLPSDQVLHEYADLHIAPDTGLPCFHLRMLEDEKGSCPFLGEKGCSVYTNRPGACRAYPLGRAARIDTDGHKEERFFFIRENHCKGFGEHQTWTPTTWMANQGLIPYNASNDRYMSLMTRQQNAAVRITPQKLGMVLMALYNVDGFQDFISRMSLLDRLDMTSARKQAILHEEEQTLAFGFDWVEMILFGSSSNIRPLH
ncbi:YkgJ family cysteine cluster protein [Desulfoplanes formicivorans]|uniref:Fe-S oxidoreductase n=1 Tax=Desulfoplanes formicivorans TaxID=1592317 RepID=A0A194ALB3_9BACT|nr:YkgJ family cysteine cluster protein [Desulfoplanes formicivorans]GAU09464.1 hypothetical protein DPF_2190 [Desulfoplanes formicivorans]